jgi:Tfp pilus assembly protein PilN
MLHTALLLLILCGVALEVLLNFGKHLLTGTRKHAVLEEQIQKAQEDLRVSQQKIEERRAALRAAVQDFDRTKSNLQAAEKAFQDSQKVVPTLVHVIGIPYSGVRFRAMVTKDLPPKPDRSQQRIWACNNFIEVWADDANAAKAAITKQFQEKQGYKVSDLNECAPEAPRPVPGVAA